MNTTLLLLSTLAAASAVSAQTIVYRETFSTTVNNSNTSTVGWGVHYGSSSATAYNNVDLSNAVTVSNLTGRLTGVDNINAGSNGAQNSTGFLFVGTQNTPMNGAPTLIWTNEYAGAEPLTTSTLSKVSFYLGNSTGAAPVRVALRVGTSWYLSETTFSTANLSGGTFGTSAELKELDFSASASAWRTVSFNSALTNPLTTNGTGNLALGSFASSALSGTITGFGIYAGASSTNSIRFDTFTVSTSPIPEPSTFAALAGLGVLCLAATRRRRR